MFSKWRKPSFSLDDDGQSLSSEPNFAKFIGKKDVYFENTLLQKRNPHYSDHIDEKRRKIRRSRIEDFILENTVFTDDAISLALDYSLSDVNCVLRAMEREGIIVHTGKNGLVREYKLKHTD